MKKALLAPALAAVAAMTTTAHAEQFGMVMGADNRVQYFNYNENDVYTINTHIGKASLIQLENGESVDDEASALGMGDAESWSLAVKGNNIIFKPIKAQPDTNIVLVTNRRTYAFDLRNAQQYAPTYIARFIYPEEAAAPAKPEEKVVPATLQQVGVTAEGQTVWIDSKFNMDYHYKGDKALKPTNVWNDGRFTYMRFNHGGDLPAIYRVLPDNSEMIVNQHIENDTVVLQEVSPVYRLRFGRQVGDVANMGVKTPTFNETNTSQDGFVRVDR